MGGGWGEVDCPGVVVVGVVRVVNTTTSGLHDLLELLDCPARSLGGMVGIVRRCIITGIPESPCLRPFKSSGRPTARMPRGSGFADENASLAEATEETTDPMISIASKMPVKTKPRMAPVYTLSRKCPRSNISV
jgi:hypothetical protein